MTILVCTVTTATQLQKPCIKESQFPPSFQQHSPSRANMKTIGNASFRHQKLFWQRVVLQITILQTSP